jgi:hypothetical protein
VWAALFLAAACTRFAPSPGDGSSARSYASSLEATIAAVRKAVPEAGLLVARAGTISDDEWRLAAVSPPNSGARAHVTVVVKREGAGTRVGVEQTTVPAEARIRLRNYAAHILALLDRQLERAESRK